MSWKIKAKYGLKRDRMGGNRKLRRESNGGFDSKLEAALYQLLLLREKAGEIRDIETQVTVYLSPMRFMYRPDFRFVDVATGEQVYAESKGFETVQWKRNYRTWKVCGPGKLEIWKGSYRNPKLVEVVKPRQTNEDSRHCETCTCRDRMEVEPSVHSVAGKTV